MTPKERKAFKELLAALDAAMPYVVSEAASYERWGALGKRSSAPMRKVIQRAEVAARTAEAFLHKTGRPSRSPGASAPTAMRIESEDMQHG